MGFITASGKLRLAPLRILRQVISAPVIGALYLLDVIIGSLERLIGHKRMPYFFVLPNMLIFMIFVLLPLILNFLFAFTGGSAIVPENRPWVGWGNFERL
ncbi:MAG: sugar ABC transporter permease, partial [Aggregatilineales bacterium]